MGGAYAVHFTLERKSMPPSRMNGNFEIRPHILYASFGALLLVSNAQAVAPSCEGGELSNDQITKIANTELSKRGAKRYRNSKISIFPFECNYVYREEYLPATPGRWFEVVISRDGSIRELVPGK